MCIGAEAIRFLPSYSQIHSLKKRQRLRRYKLQVHRLMTRRRTCAVETGTGMRKKKSMELKNIKLYLENQTIIEENEKLRKKANLLHQENLALISEFRQRFPSL